jgi:hypothetical protein
VHEEQPLFSRQKLPAKAAWLWPLAQRTGRAPATISTRAPPLVYRPFGRLALRSPPHSTPRTTPRRKQKTTFFICALSNHATRD